MARCNPYGYATEAGPRHLMGGMYGPEYAGHGQLVLKDGIHGIGICQNAAAGRWRMVCEVGHTGPVMDLCQPHVGMIQKRMAGTCTRCVWPDRARELDEAMTYVMRRMAEASARRDRVALVSYNAKLDQLRANMDDLMRSGAIVKRPLRLVEVS